MARMSERQRRVLRALEEDEVAAADPERGPSPGAPILARASDRQVRDAEDALAGTMRRSAAQQAEEDERETRLDAEDAEYRARRRARRSRLREEARYWS